MSAFNDDIVCHRTIDELLGLCQGIIADGKVCQKEAEFLQKWLVNADSNCNIAIINMLSKKLDAMLHDNILDDEESRELLDFLEKFAGANYDLGEVQKSTDLPIDDNCDIDLVEKTIVLTGSFSHGKRKEIEFALKNSKNSKVQKDLTQKTNILVIGEYVAPDWKHSSFGTKIMKAMKYKEKGCDIKIISERKLFSDYPFLKGYMS